MYLTRVTRLFYTTLLAALGIEETSTSREEAALTHIEYREGDRTRRERTFFARNAKLSKDAKILKDYTCEVCGFSPRAKYNSGYETRSIECHHLKMLAGRSADQVTTTLDDVAVVCANCHGLIHARKTPLSIAEARAALRA
jgi:predicted HNH restriction endonuclease